MIWGASEPCNWWTGMAYLGQRRTTKLWPAKHIAHIEALMRCIKGVTKKSAANLWHKKSQKCSNLCAKLSLVVVNLFGSFREGCRRIFRERESGLYFELHTIADHRIRAALRLSCRSWIFLAIYVRESSSDMNPLRTWRVASCVTVNF